MVSVLDVLGWSLVGSVNEAPRVGEDDIQEHINSGEYMHVYDISKEAKEFLLEQHAVKGSHLTETRNVGSNQEYHYTVSTN